MSLTLQMSYYQAKGEGSILSKVVCLWWDLLGVPHDLSHIG